MQHICVFCHSLVKILLHNLFANKKILLLSLKSVGVLAKFIISIENINHLNSLQ